MAKTAIFRADAGVSIGGGHVHRCLALADALRDRGWTVGFACQPAAPIVVPGLAEPGIELLILGGGPADELAAMQARWPDGVDVLVVDHYERDATYEQAAKPWARKVAALDDVPSRRHRADILLDQTAGRVEADYRGLVSSGAVVLAGSHYVLLRPAIKRQPCPDRPASRQAKKAFVSFGSTDPDDVTRRALAALRGRGLDGLEAAVVVGPQYAWRDEITSSPPKNIRVYVDPPEMPKLMAEADVAVAGSGTTAWELAYFGVPALLVINSAGSVVNALVTAGAARLLGGARNVTSDLIADALASLLSDLPAREAMSAAGRRLIDGQGAQRVADVLESRT